MKGKGIPIFIKILSNKIFLWGAELIAQSLLNNNSACRNGRKFIIVNDQLDHNSFSICLFQFSTCFEQTRSHHQENQLYQYNIWYMSLFVGDRLVCRSVPDLNTRRSPTQSDTYQMLY
jgi:hypothetical protein